MALVPRYEQRTRTALGGVSGGLRGVDTGSELIGQALQRAGNAVTGFGDDVHGLEKAQATAARKIQDQADESWWTGQAPDASLNIAKAVSDVRAATPDNGQGYADSVRLAVEKEYAPYEAQAKTAKARELVAKAKADALTRYGEAAVTYQRNAYETWRGAQNDLARSKAVDAVRAAPLDMVDDIVASSVAAFDGSLGDLDPIDRVKARAEFGKDVAAAAYERRVLETAEATGKVTGGTVADAVNRIIDKREGTGLNPNDNGRPSKFGIRADKADGTRNGIPVKDLTREQAFDIYMKEYASEIGLNEVTFAQNPAYAEVLLDAAVNHGAGTAKKLADQAGGDWRKLIGLRVAEYERLARENPAKYGDDLAGWRKRMQGLERDAASLERRGPDLVSLLTPPEAKAAAIKKAETAVATRNDRKRGELDIAIERGTAGAADIERGVREGWIERGSPDWVSLTKTADVAVKKAQKAAEQQARLNLALQQGVPLDPHSTEDRKAMNADYDARAGGWAPDQWAAQSIQYARKVGMVPDGLKGRITGGLRSANPDQRLAAAKTYADLRAQAPNTVREFSDDDVRDANLMISYARMGLSPKEAADAIALGQKLTNDERTARDHAFTAALGPKQQEADNFLAKAISGDKAVQEDRGFLGARFDVPPEMMADFKRASQLAYRRTGDVNAAMNAGYDQISRAWGPSVFNGKPVFMKNAPEVVYGVPGQSASDNAKWIRRQLAEQTNMHGEAKDLRLIESPLQRGGRPVYFIMKAGENGALEPVSKGGQPLYFQPDWNTSPTKKDQDKKAAEARDKEMARARATRDRLGVIDPTLTTIGAVPARAGGM